MSRRPGRRPDPIRSQFARVSEDEDVVTLHLRCKHCRITLPGGHTDTLHAHLQGCACCPEEVKRQYRTAARKKRKTGPAENEVAEEEEELDETDVQARRARLMARWLYFKAAPFNLVACAPAKKVCVVLLRPCAALP